MAKTYYQYYTNVTPRTCPECLASHGRIARDPTVFPDRHDGCPRKLLAFGAKDLDHYREQERLMRAAAAAELERRALLAQARAALGTEADTALALLRRAAEIDVHVEEVEVLCREARATLDADPTLRERLRLLLARAYSDKFGHPRYERLPEVMRLAQERAGVEQINALLS